ncbi:MAG: hemerythrin domain-containing protein, partial [Candidatus Dormibacteria bacterium]
MAVTKSLQVLVGEARGLAQSSARGTAVRPLLERPELRALLIDLEPGRELPPHTPGSALILSVLDGAGELLADGRLYQMRAGDLAVIPAGQSRGLRCREGRLIALGVVAPPPGATDHRPSPGAVAWPQPVEGPDPARLIREEHLDLLEELGRLDRLVESDLDLESGRLAVALRSAVAFFKRELLPHAEAEERLVYPAVERVLRAAGGSTQSMTLDHRRIRDLTLELEHAASAPRGELDRAAAQRALVSLLAVVHLHLDKEEEDYLPRLSQLGPAERTGLVRALRGAEEIEPGAD